MKTYYTKPSKKAFLSYLLGFLAIIVAIEIAIQFAHYYSSYHYVAGFYSATITLKWKDWIYTPIAKFIDRSWPEYKELNLGDRR